MENKQDKGFTLVELLIVIVILGILATVTVFAVRGITDQGQGSACAADKKTLEVAVEAYYAQKGNVLGAAATETNLIQAGLLTSYSPNYNVASGQVVAGDQTAIAAIPAGTGTLAAPAAVVSTTKCTTAGTAAP
jgi:prepilin-type N-terminal cleavage/methylation domain-containing protein